MHMGVYQGRGNAQLLFCDLPLHLTRPRPRMAMVHLSIVLAPPCSCAWCGACGLGAAWSRTLNNRCPFPRAQAGCQVRVRADGVQDGPQQQHQQGRAAGWVASAEHARMAICSMRMARAWLGGMERLSLSTRACVPTRRGLDLVARVDLVARAHLGLHAALSCVRP